MMMHPEAKVGAITDREDLSSVPTNPWFLYVLTGCSTIGGFLFGYDTGVISGALVLLKSPDVFNLTSFQSESIVSVAVVGAIMGAGLSSFGTHSFGRKPVIIASTILFTWGSILMGFARVFDALLVGRFIVGLGLGLSSMTVPLYMAEVSPPQIRGRVVSLNTVLVTGGQFFACVLAALLSRSHDGWRYMLGLAAIPAVIQLMGFLLLPESPRYLISKGKKKAAWAALVQIRGTDNVENEYNLIETDVQKHAVNHQESKINLWNELRTPSVARALVLGCSLQALQQICGINTVMYYGATIIQMAGFADPSTAIWLSVVVSFSNFIFTFVGIYLVERMGRRRLTLFSLAGVVLTLLALGGSFYGAQEASMPVTGSGVCAGLSSCFECVAKQQCGVCQTSATSSICIAGSASGAAIASQCPSPQQWLYATCPSDSSLAKWFILIALFVYLACFASGMGSMPWTINAEIYPLHVRSFALGASTSVNWIANLLVSFTFLSIIEALAPYGAFWLYAILATFGFLYLYRALPETKGLELEEIQQLFEHPGCYERIHIAHLT